MCCSNKVVPAKYHGPSTQPVGAVYLLTDDYKVCVGVRVASSIGDTTLMAGKDQILYCCKEIK